MRRIPPALDPCRGQKPSPDQLLDEGIIVEDGTLPYSTAMKVGVTGKGSIGVEAAIGNAPLKLSISYERSLEEELEMSTTLGPGAMYHAFFPAPGADADLTARCWSVGPVPSL